MRIRGYEPTDHDRVLELHEEALREAGGFVEGVAEPDLQDIERAYLEDGTFLVGEQDDEILAMGAVRPSAGYLADELESITDRTGEIKRIRVDPTVQGQGLGKELYDSLESRAKALGFESAVLDTNAEQTEAQQFFESLGFRRVKEATFDVEGERFSLVFYRKEFG